jgi:alpha-tubulin suppressor-like RCC1 family protein
MDLFLVLDLTKYFLFHKKQGLIGLGDAIDLILTPTIIPNLQDIQQVSTGFYHSLALNKNGLVFGFGSNEKVCLYFPNKVSTWNSRS